MSFITGNTPFGIINVKAEYRQGWLGLLGYVVGAAVGGYVPASIVQGLTVLFASDYVYQRWHGTLIIFAVAIFSVLFNTFLARKLPKIEIAMLVCHVVGFFAILIPLWVCGPHNSAADVFTKFTNSGGWPSTGLSCLVGLTAPVFSLIGPDSTVHMGKIFLPPLMHTLPGCEIY